MFKRITDLKFAGDLDKFIKDPLGMKTMVEYKKYVKEHLPFLLNSEMNVNFDPFDSQNIETATKFILNKLSNQHDRALSAKG